MLTREQDAFGMPIPTPINIALGYGAEHSTQGVLRLRAGIEIWGRAECTLTGRSTVMCRARRLVIPPPSSRRFGIVDLKVGFHSVFVNDNSYEVATCPEGTAYTYWPAIRYEGSYKFSHPEFMLDVLVNPGPARALISGGPGAAIGGKIPARICQAGQNLSITVRPYEDDPSDFEALLLCDLLW